METSFFFRLTFLSLKIAESWEVTVQAFNPNTWETEHGKISEFKASLVYRWSPGQTELH